MKQHRKTPRRTRATTFGIWTCIAVAATVFSGSAAAQQTTDQTGPGTIIAGWVENAWLGVPTIRVKAKLDTGAKSSSINAPDAEEFLRDGTTWVRFRVVNGDDKATTIEQPVVRHVRIRRAGVGKKERPVISLKVCVGGHTAETAFTLADRSGMSYQVLMGRHFMADRILVNSAKTFLVSKRCSGGN